jgi:hypothetical protein
MYLKIEQVNKFLLATDNREKGGLSSGRFLQIRGIKWNMDFGLKFLTT